MRDAIYSVLVGPSVNAEFRHGGLRRLHSDSEPNEGTTTYLTLSWCFFMDGFVIAGLVAIGICAVLAVHLRDILRAAIALAVLSVVLAAIFFKLGAPYAGAFELSVCAGLVTVLFVAAISSVGAKTPEQSEQEEE